MTNVQTADGPEQSAGRTMIEVVLGLVLGAVLMYGTFGYWSTWNYLDSNHAYNSAYADAVSSGKDQSDAHDEAVIESVLQPLLGIALIVGIAFGTPLILVHLGAERLRRGPRSSGLLPGSS